MQSPNIVILAISITRTGIEEEVVVKVDLLKSN
jgi:hypothetical protein